MALSVASLGANDYQTTVEDVRQLVRAMFPGHGLIHGSPTFEVSPSQEIPEEGGRAVQIGPGAAVLSGTLAPSQGSYLVWSAEPEVLAWPAPDGQPRVDALVISVADAQYGTVEDQGPTWQVVTGTSSTSPVAPSDGEIESAVGEGAWLRVANVRVTPDSDLTPSDITTTAGPASGGWKPLDLESGNVVYQGRTPSYRIEGGQVWLAGAIAKASGAEFSSAETFGGTVATVPTEARPPRICYGLFQSTAKRSVANFVGGGLLRGECRASGELVCYRFNMEYTTSFISFDGFHYWLDQDQ